MRSGVRSGGATTIALEASGVANSADLEPAVQLPSAPWSWSGEYIGGDARSICAQTCFSHPAVPSVYCGRADTPAFSVGDQIGYNSQKNGWVFGLKCDVHGSVSNCINTCLAGSGIAVRANCKAGPSVFVTGAGRLGLRFGHAGPHHALPQGKGGLAMQISATARSTSARREVYFARTERRPKGRSTSSPTSVAPSTAGRSNARSRTATHSEQGSLANHQFHREPARHRAIQEHADEGLLDANHRQADGVRAGDRSIRDLAAA